MKLDALDRRHSAPPPYTVTNPTDGSLPPVKLKSRPVDKSSPRRMLTYLFGLSSEPSGLNFVPLRSIEEFSALIALMVPEYESNPFTVTSVMRTVESKIRKGGMRQVLYQPTAVSEANAKTLAHTRMGYEQHHQRHREPLDRVCQPDRTAHSALFRELKGRSSVPSPA